MTNVKYLPSTHVVYEGLEKVKNDILEDEETKPVLSYAKSKAINEKQLINLAKLHNFKTRFSLWLFNRYRKNRYYA